MLVNRPGEREAVPLCCPEVHRATPPHLQHQVRHQVCTENATSSLHEIFYLEQSRISLFKMQFHNNFVFQLIF